MKTSVGGISLLVAALRANIAPLGSMFGLAGCESRGNVRHLGQVMCDPIRDMVYL